MVSALSSNTILAAAFGFGAVKPVRSFDVTRAQGDRTSTTPSTRDEPQDVVEISAEGRELSLSQANARQGKTLGSGKAESASAQQAAQDPSGKALSKEEQQQVRKLKERDSEVRRHEQAHKAAAGSNASGGPSFEFETGPDGQRYAVGGEVNVDTSPVAGDPQATIAKMQQIRRAALAPANPSSQDRAVAAQASAAEQSARAELAQRRAESTGGTGQAGASSATPSQNAVRSSASTFGQTRSSKSDASSERRSQLVGGDPSEVGTILDAIA